MQEGVGWYALLGKANCEVAGLADGGWPGGRASERASSEGRNPEDFAVTKQVRKKVEIMPLPRVPCMHYVIFREAAIEDSLIHNERIIRGRRASVRSASPRGLSLRSAAAAANVVVQQSKCAIRHKICPQP